jgi:hypothetical protein
MGAILELDNEGKWIYTAHPLFTREYIEQCRESCAVE